MLEINSCSDLSLADAPELPTIRTFINYSLRDPESTRAVDAIDLTSPGEIPDEQLLTVPHEVEIQDIRQQVKDFTLPKDGFAWAKIEPLKLLAKGQNEEEWIAYLKGFAEDLVKKE